MAKKTWDLKHSKITLSSNRREIIVEYKDNPDYCRTVWHPIEHYNNVFDEKGHITKVEKYVSIGGTTDTTDGLNVGTWSLFHIFLSYWANHTATMKKIYGYFSDDIPTYALQCFDCYLEEEIDWKPEDYGLSNDPFPENVKDLIKSYN